MTFIAGVEISVTWAGHTVHVLGLNVDENDAGLLKGLEGIRQGRAVRAREIADRLAALGIPDSFEGASSYAANPSLISRTHFARFLIDQGHCKNMQMVFDKYLGDGKPGNVRSEERRVGKSVSVRVDLGGRRIIKKKKKQ